jgi:hypothetical protein
MKTPAVTEETPAVSSTQSIEEALESGFLPEDPEYLKTGKFSDKEATKSAAFTEKKPGEETDTETEKETPGKDDTQGDDKTAAASAAAQTEEQKQEAERKAGKKTADTSESRWAKITRQNKELRETNQRLEREAKARATAGTETQRETTQGSQPAAGTKPAPTRPEPKIDDVDPKTGKAKYAQYSDFQADQRAWDREQVLAEVKATSTQSAKDAQLEQAERVIQQEVYKRVKKAREAYSDYDEVMATALEEKNEHGGDLIYIAKGSPIDLFMLDSPRGTDVFYEIAKNLDQHKHIFTRDAKGNFTMSAVRQLRELAKIEGALEAPPEKKAAAALQPVTRAGRPAHQTSGAATKDAVQRAVEEGDSETYMREQNARELARRKKG